MKIYLASRFDNKENLKPIADRLRELDHELTSDWVEQESRTDNFEDAMKWAWKDITDVGRADVLILDCTAGPGKGMYVELGYAIARHKLILVIGESGTIFTTLPFCTVFESWEHFFSQAPELL